MHQQQHLALPCTRRAALAAIYVAVDGFFMRISQVLVLFIF
jgi:hypothetical protein